MSGRAVEASGDVDVILLDKTGTITYGNRLAASITPAPGVTEAEAVEAALVASIRDETPEGRSIVELARKRLAELGRPAGVGDDAGFAALGATIAEEIAVPRRDPHQRRHDHGRRRRSSRARSTRSRRRSAALPAERRRRGRPDRRPRRDAARPRERGPGPRRHRAQGHRQGGPRRAVRRVPPDGHPDGDDHRRQPADRGDHRQGGRRRRLHRAGHARGEDRVHPDAAGRGPPRRDDRRRHQRRARRSPSPTSGWR